MYIRINLENYRNFFFGPPLPYRRYIEIKKIFPVNNDILHFIKLFPVKQLKTHKTRNKMLKKIYIKIQQAHSSTSKWW